LRILLSGYTGLGNMVLKTPLVRHLHDQLPNLQLDLIAGSGFGAEQVLSGSKWFNQIIIVKAEEKELQEKLMSELTYDFCFLPFDAAPSFLPGFLANCDIGQTVRHYLPNADRSTFISHEADDAILRKYEIQSPYIVIQPGAANGTDPTKVWDVYNFIALIRKWINHYGCPIVLVGDDGDYKSAIEPLMKVFENDDRVINTAGKTSISDLKNLLWHSSAILCHDSGVMHIADAMEKNLVAMFGPSDYNRIRPLRKSSVSVRSNTEYFNAKHYFKSFTVKHLKSGQPPNYPMKGITVDNAFDALQSIYGQK